MSVALLRIDDRLVHGQVLVAWGSALRARRLLVVDDEVAADPLERDLLCGVAGDVGVTVCSVAESPAALADEADRSGACIVLFRSPAVALAVLDAGASMPELNLGGLHYAPGKEPVLAYLYLDDRDRAALRALAARGVHLSAQDVPASRPVEVAPLLEGHAA